LVAG
jgi:hypothetical protein